MNGFDVKEYEMGLLGIVIMATGKRNPIVLHYIDLWNLPLPIVVGRPLKG